MVHSVPCRLVPGGCGARAVSRKTPIYFFGRNTTTDVGAVISGQMLGVQCWASASKIARLQPLCAFLCTCLCVCTATTTTVCFGGY